MILEIENLESIKIEHGSVGKELLKISSGRLFPCYALYLAVLNRSIELFDGFVLLAKNNNYGCCMALLRMQLDNVLRFNGVLQTENIHETAYSILKGEKLSKIKDSQGNFLKDVFLKELLAKDNPWVIHVYDLTSGYIHLSGEHMGHMLKKSVSVDKGLRNFYVSSDSGHVSDQHKIEMINAFKVITEGVFKMINALSIKSRCYSTDDLEKCYPACA